MRFGNERAALVDSDGYVRLTREWRAGDSIETDLAMPAQVVRGNAAIAATEEQVAFERGPVVYCFEPADQPIPASVAREPQIVAREQSGPLGRLTVLDVDGAIAVPYFAWNNRGLAPMAVWRPVK